MSKDFEPVVSEHGHAFTVKDKDAKAYYSDDGKWTAYCRQLWPTREAAQKAADDYLRRKRNKRDSLDYAIMTMPYQMGPPTLPQRAQQIYNALEGIEPDEQKRVLTSVSVLLGLSLGLPKPKEEPEAAKPEQAPTVTPSWLSGLRAEVVYAVQNGASPVKVTQLFDEYVARTMRNG